MALDRPKVGEWLVSAQRLKFKWMDYFEIYLAHGHQRKTGWVQKKREKTIGTELSVPDRSE